jgi:hypothetical protein
MGLALAMSVSTAANLATGPTSAAAETVETAEAETEIAEVAKGTAATVAAGADRPNTAKVATESAAGHPTTETMAGQPS